MTPEEFAVLRSQLRQLITADAYDLWVALYASGAGQTEQQEVEGVLALVGRSPQLAAATMLEAMASLAGGASAIKLGPLEIKLNPAAYLERASQLRTELRRGAGAAQLLRSPLAGLVTGRSETPQAFTVGGFTLPPDGRTTP